MKKIFSLLAAVLFAGSMMASVGNLYYTATFLKGTSAAGNNISGYDKTGNYTSNGLTWTIPGNNTNGDYIRIGGKSINSVERVIAAQTKMEDAIAKIVVSHNGVSRDAVVVDSVVLTVASNAAFTADVVKKIYTPASPIKKSAAGTIEFLADEKWNIDSYYKFSFYISNSTTSNGGLDVTKIEFFSYLDDSAPAIMAEKIDFGMIATTAFPAVQNAELAVTGANLTDAIAYSVIGENVTVTGSLTAAGGTLNVALSANAEGEISDTIVLTSGATVAKVPVVANILQTSGDGSKENPFSVADVVKLNNGYGMEKYWVMGYIVGSAANGGALATTDAASNIAIGDAAEQTEGLVPVELPSGDIRTALNIVDHAENKGKLVKVHGQLISYFLWSGVKATDDYEFVEEPAGCDWDAIDFLGDGSPEQTFGNQFKICKAGEQPSVVNIQKPGFAAETGIYVTFPSAVFGEISLSEGQYATQGAGMVLYLSAFTQEYTEVTVNCDGNDIVFTVYNAKASATAINNTADEIKAFKTIENGQLVIIKNGVRYDATGAVIR